ncbi:nuclear pore complex protein Nup85-like [Ornithodoros turicata]|uniref:nuclear pore complex protein Nup85-like n=1 Tax=Ornithodoros turicata TaxID=34597 RepID=UPI00313A0783
MLLGTKGEALVKAIHDPAFASANIGCTLGIGSSLLVYPTPKGYQKHTGTPRGTSKHDVYGPHQVAWGASLDCPVTRKLANESCGVFLLLQKSASASQQDNAYRQLVKISRGYRAILHGCIESCMDAANDSDARADYQRKSELLHHIELAWHLCEILFVDVQPGTALLSQLQYWAVCHMSEPTASKIRDILSEEEVHKSSEYWNMVYLLVAQARLDEARKLLRCHPQSGRDDFVALDQLLEAAPQGSQQTSTMDLQVWFQGWQKECQIRLQNGEFSLLTELEKVCRILLGDEATFYEIRDLFDSWYHYLVAKLTYTEPVVQIHELGAMAEECVALFGGTKSAGLLDGVLLSLFRLDLQQVLRESSLFLDNWWFSAHLADLLFHGGQLEVHKVDYAAPLREHIILEYVSSLMSHHSLWQVGVDYLDHCPRQGRPHLEVYLEHIPFKTQAEALKIVNIAEQREMWSTAESICHVMATRLQSQDQLGAALTWAIHCKDTTLTSRLADKLLLEYAQQREFSCCDILENLGEEMLLSDRLTFLAKYREYHQETDSKRAAKLLVALIESELAPCFFWPVLIRDASALLQDSQDLVLDETQILQLEGCLETVSRSVRKISHTTQQQPWTEEEERCARLLLAENLAQAFIQEGSCTSV